LKDKAEAEKQKADVEQKNQTLLDQKSEEATN
jgi:hypothetical protein